MKESIERRITELRDELEAGHRLQTELRARHDELGRTLLRISGAIQVLGEMLADADTTPSAPAGDAAPPLRVVAAG